MIYDIIYIMTNADKTYDVGMSECRTTRSKLSTCGASTCIVLAALNREEGNGLLGHFSEDDIASGELVIDAVEAVSHLGSGEHTQIRLAGGGVSFSDGRFYPEVEKSRRDVSQRVNAMAKRHGIPLSNIQITWLAENDVADVEIDVQQGVITVVEEKEALLNTFEPKYSILKNAEQREELVQRTLELVEQFKSHEIETVVWLDRAARPFSWFTEAIWNQQYPDSPVPEFVYLNVGGEKNLRARYMPESGITDNLGNFHQQFAGIYEGPEKLALFEKRIRVDKEVQHQLREELGPTAGDNFTNKKILIVDHLEFEGVSRLFTQYILDATYSPGSIDYFEFGQLCGAMPTGLENPDVDPSFLARESEDSNEVTLVSRLKQELAALARTVEPV